MSRCPPLLLVLVLVLALAGCTGDGGRASSRAPATVEEYAAWMTHQAARETPGAPRARGAVPLPRALSRAAGVHLESRAGEIEARLSLDEALDRLADAPEALPPAQLAPDVRAAALGHYVRGIDLGLTGDTAGAIEALEDARAFDPTAPAVLRALAHRYGARGDTGMAIARFEDLLESDPYDREALLTVAMAAHLRREHGRAVRLLARRSHAPADAADDPGADRVALHVLHQALAELGYDRAAIDAGVRVAKADDAVVMPSRFSARLSAIHRARAEIWRAVGDAWMRLDDPSEAVAAYDAAARAPVTDPTALLWRAVYARLRLGRPVDAQRMIFDALRATAPDCPAHLVDMAAWMRAAEGDAPEPLVTAAEGLAAEYPDSAALVRTVAVLLPPDPGLERLAAFVSRHPRDLPGVRGMLQWLADREPAQAIDLAAELVAAQPDLAEDYANELLLAIPRASEVTEPLDAPRDAPHAALAALVLMRAGCLGAAWEVCANGRAASPGDAGLSRIVVNAAARLDEEALVRDAIATAPADDTAPAWTAVLHARALGVINDLDAALAMLDRATAMDTDGRWARAIALTRARLRVVQAEAATGAARDAAATAAEAAIENVLAEDPTDGEAWALLLGLYDRGGLRAEETDGSERSELAERARRDAPNSTIVLRLDVERDLLRGLADQAIDAARAWAERDPQDEAAYGALALAYERAGRPHEFSRWIESTLVLYPAAPVPLEARIGAMLRNERTTEALQLLERRLRADPGDRVASRLLERVYQVRGELDAAADLALERLALRPAGARRALEEGLVLARAGRADGTLDRIDDIVKRAAEGTVAVRHLVGAAGLLDALDAGPRRDETAIRLAEAAVAMGDLPLVVLAPGVEAMARADADGARVDAFVPRALSAVREAHDPSPGSVGAWRRLSQRLVDAGQADVAARILRGRLRADLPLDPNAERMFLALAIMADAGTGHGAEASMDLLHELAQKGLDPLLAGLPTGDLVEALFETAQMYSLIGDGDGAAVILREVLRLDPDHAMALNNLGYYRLESGALDERTTAMIEQAWRLQPDDANVADTVAWLRYHQNRLEEPTGAEAGALMLLERLAGGREPSAEVLDHFGDTLWRVGRTVEAESAWRQARRYLGDERRKALIIRNLGLLQVQSWGLLVVDPNEAWQSAFGGVLARVEAKLDAVRQGSAPPIATPLGGPE